jgi:preprotein translocase subunit Sss1
MAKKKAEDMREELRNIISFTRGPSAWNELLATEANIRKKRQEAIYAQEEYRRKVIEWIAIALAVCCVLGMIGFFIWLAMDQRGMI